MRTLYRCHMPARTAESYQCSFYAPRFRPFHLRVRQAQYRKTEAIAARQPADHGKAWMTGYTTAVVIPAPDRTRRPVARNRRK